MKTVEIKKIPFPTWGEFKKIKCFELPNTCVKIKLVASNDNFVLAACIETKDEFFRKFYKLTPQGYEKARDYLQTEFEKLIEEMASLR